jgi:hypothetical protein
MNEATTEVAGKKYLNALASKYDHNVFIFKELSPDTGS